MLRVCIVGCGAVGSLFAAHLARKGEAEVWAYDVWKDHVEAIRNHGLRISGAADFTAKLNATSDPSELPRCDYGIVATKAIHTRGAIAQVARAFDENSAVCSVQNGVGNEEIIAEHVKYVIRGTTFPAGHPIAPGHIGFDIKGDTWIGPFEPTNTPMSKVEELAGLITRSGMNVIPLQDARGAQWTKLIFNAATNPVGALTLLHHGAATRFAPDRPAVQRPDRRRRGGRQGAGHRTARRSARSGAKRSECAGQASRIACCRTCSPSGQTEVDFMNGAIVKWGEKTGVRTPLNKAVWELVKGLEHSWSDPE